MVPDVYARKMYSYLVAYSPGAKQLFFEGWWERRPRWWERRPETVIDVRIGKKLCNISFYVSAEPTAPPEWATRAIGDVKQKMRGRFGLFLCSAYLVTLTPDISAVFIPRTL